MGMIQRDHVNGSLLWEIGDSTIGTTSQKLSPILDVNGLPTNLLDLVAISGGYIWITVPENPIYTSGAIDLRQTTLKAYTEFNGYVYNITSAVTFAVQGVDGVVMNGQEVYNTILAANAMGGEFGSFASNIFTAVAWPLGTTYQVLRGAPELYPPAEPTSWRDLALGDVTHSIVTISVVTANGTLTAKASVNVQMTN